MRLLLFCFAGFVQLSLGIHWFGNQGLNSDFEQEIDEDNDQFFDMDIEPAAGRFEQYEPFLEGKRLGLVVNHTSRVGKTHLVDTLLKRGHKIQKIFAPEHGFRGDADAGEKVSDKIDERTKLPIISVYGENKKPSAAQLADIDLIIFDIQDVGVRFYTYTSTMTYMMEICAETQKPMLILDRPNPNGHYVDGGILQPAQRSFVGLHPVPIIHGLTVAEYARMINEEGWLANKAKCELYYVECANYKHSKFYKLPVKPSPNLTNMRSIYLYASLCLFEGTTVSVGRGTDKPFQIYGHPDFKKGSYHFTPTPRAGSKTPLHQDKKCNGYNLSNLDIRTLQQRQALDLSYVFDFYKNFPDKDAFFVKSNFFDLLAGDTTLRTQLVQHISVDSVRKSWQPNLENYKALRKKYLLYAE